MSSEQSVVDMLAWSDKPVCKDRTPRVRTFEGLCDEKREVPMESC